MAMRIIHLNTTRYFSRILKLYACDARQRSTQNRPNRQENIMSQIDWTSEYEVSVKCISNVTNNQHKFAFNVTYNQGFGAEAGDLHEIQMEPKQEPEPVV